MKARFLTLVLVVTLLLAALPIQAQGPVQIRWYVGLGAGTDAPVIPVQEALVQEFNDSQDEIELLIEIVDNDQAYDVLSTQIAAGNAPDIVGPMGVRGRASYPGAWLDLQPLIDATGFDMTDFDPALVDFYRIEGEGQLGIPFAVFPSFMMYNADLFDEADIPYPPTAYGEPYIDWEGNEREWNMETLREVAMILTVDVNGNDATMEEFDPDNIVAFGFGNQFTDLRGRDTLFGSGNVVDEDGNAQFPEQWREAEHWYHQAMWEDYFYPNGIYDDSDLLGGAGVNWFNTGNIGMILIHLWYVGWGTADLDATWDFAPVPSYEGVTTAKLHADTFSIMNTTEHPEEAFEVLTYLLGDRAEELNQLYGGMPARLSLQDGFFDRYTESLAEPYPNVDWANLNWDVVVESLAYPDNPNHEEAMPSFLETTDRYTEYIDFVNNNADADIDAELDQLVVDMQAIFDAVAGE